LVGVTPKLEVSYLILFLVIKDHLLTTFSNIHQNRQIVTEPIQNFMFRQAVFYLLCKTWERGGSGASGGKSHPGGYASVKNTPGENESGAL
jgi:hypothetical protein